MMQRYQGGTGVAPQDFPSTLVAMNVHHAWALAQAEAFADQTVDQYAATLIGPLVVSYLLVGHRQTGERREVTVAVRVAVCRPAMT